MFKTYYLYFLLQNFNNYCFLVLFVNGDVKKKVLLKMKITTSKKKTLTYDHVMILIRSFAQ